MDGLSVAASIVGIATAGVQVSIKLVTLATQIRTASDRVSSIGNDISLTSSVLHQLGELMRQNATADGISILNQHGIQTTKTSAAMCERIFREIEKEVTRASEQLRNCKPSRGRMSGEKIELSMKEKAKWPFLQPKIDNLRTDLRDAKSTLMLMLQLAGLALSKKAADASMSTSENQDFVRAIVAWELQRREERAHPEETPEVTNNFSPDNTPNAENTKTRSLEKDSSDKHARGFLNTFVTMVPSFDSKPLLSEKKSNAPENPANDSLHTGISPDDDSMTKTNHNDDLQLFLLKPIVEDLVNRIELRWFLQNTNMEYSAIYERVIENKSSGLPSVLEMLQQLHTHEQDVVDSEAAKGFERSILSLERTKTDIHCRDMLFKAVPGLQFVVGPQFRRNVRQPAAPPILDGVRSSMPARLPSFSFRQHDRQSAFSSLPVGATGHYLAGGASRRRSCMPSVSHRKPPPVPPSVLDSQTQEDKEAEAMVTDLLGQYTTLFAV